MEDPQTKGVLLDSIESHRDHLLSEEEQRINSFRKGKAPATQEDLEQQARLDKKLKDLAEDYKSISENKASRQQDNPRRLSAETFLLASRPGGRSGVQLNAVQETPDSSEDEEPIWNPFTSSYVHRETGFEPGPSNSRCQSDTPQSSEDDHHNRFEALVSFRPELNFSSDYLKTLILYFRPQNCHSREGSMAP